MKINIFYSANNIIICTFGLSPLYIGKIKENTLKLYLLSEYRDESLMDYTSPICVRFNDLNDIVYDTLNMEVSFTLVKETFDIDIEKVYNSILLNIIDYYQYHSLLKNKLTIPTELMRKVKLNEFLT